MAQRVIRWAREALDDIDEACDYVGQSGPEASDGFAARVEFLVNELLEYPEIGRKVPEYNREELRERIVKPFRILYRLSAQEIEVLGIFYDRRLLPGDF